MAQVTQFLTCFVAMGTPKQKQIKMHIFITIILIVTFITTTTFIIIITTIISS